MAEIELVAELRQIIGKKVKGLRAEGWVPAVLYGSSIDAQSIQAEAKALRRVLQQAGLYHLISLKVGKKKPVMVLARNIQRSPVKHELLHVDFQQVVMTEKIATEVPLHLAGEAPAVKELGGILVQGLDALQIECLPSDLPPAIEVDISRLAEYNAAISVGDLSLPEAITILSDPDSLIAKIEAPRLVEEIEELEEPAEAEEAEPEVIGEAGQEEAGQEA